MEQRCNRKHGDNFPQHKMIKFCIDPGCQTRLACEECEKDYHKDHKLVKLSHFHRFCKGNKLNHQTDMITHIHGASMEIQMLIAQIGINTKYHQETIQDFSHIDIEESANLISNSNLNSSEVLDCTYQALIQQMYGLHQVLTNINQFNGQQFLETRRQIEDRIIEPQDTKTFPRQKQLIINTGYKVTAIGSTLDYVACGGYEDHAIRVWDTKNGDRFGETLQGHTDIIKQISFSNCGHYMVSCSLDKTIREWHHLDAYHSYRYEYEDHLGWEREIKEFHIESFRLCQSISGHQDYVMGVQYSPNDEYIISGSWDQTIRFWRPSQKLNGQQQIECEQKRFRHTDLIFCLSLSPIESKVAFGDDQGVISIFDYSVDQDYTVQLMKGHSGLITSLKYSSDGKLIVSGSSDETIRVWDTEIGTNLCQCNGHIDFVQQVGFSQSMKYIISGGRDSTVRIWNRFTGNQIGKSLKYHNNEVWSVQLDQYGRIITGGFDKQLIISDFYSLITGNKLKNQNKTIIRIGRAAKEIKQLIRHITTDIQQIYANIEDYSQIDINALTDEILNNLLHTQDQKHKQQMKILDQTYKALMQELDCLRQQITNIKVINDHLLQNNLFEQDIGDQDWYQNEDNLIQQKDMLDLKTFIQQEPLILDFKNNKVCAIALSPNRKDIAIASCANEILIWNLTNGLHVEQKCLKGHTDRIVSINYSNCGRFIVSSSCDQTIRQWDLQENTQINVINTGKQGVVRKVQYNSNQEYIVSLSDSTIKFWNPISGDEYVGKRIEQMFIWCFSLSPIQTDIAFGDSYGVIHIWNYEQNHKKGKPIQSHQRYVSTLQYSQDGKILLSGSNDNTIRILDLQTREVIICIGHQCTVQSVAFSPDMKYIVSAGQDNTVRLWNRQTGKQIGQSLQSYQVHSIYFTQEGQNIIIGAVKEVNLVHIEIK